MNPSLPIIARNTARGLSSGERVVLMCLILHRNHKTHQCNPSQKLIGEECEMSLRTVSRHISSLVAKGYIVATHDPHKTTSYTIILNEAGSAIGRSTGVLEAAKQTRVGRQKRVNLGRQNTEKLSICHDKNVLCDTSNLATPLTTLGKSKGRNKELCAGEGESATQTQGSAHESVGSMNGEGVSNPVPCTESETTMNDPIDYHRNEFGVYTPYSLHFLKDWHRKPTINPLSPKSPLDPAYADAFSDSGETYRHLNSALCLELLAQNPGWADKLDNMMRYEERGPRDTSAQGVLAWKMRNVRDWWHDTATAPTYYSHGRYEAYRTMSQLPAKCRTAVDKALDTVKRTVSKGDLLAPIYAKLTAGDKLRVSVDNTLTSDPQSDYFAYRPEVLIGWDNTIYELTDKVKRSVVYCLGVTSPAFVNPSSVSIAERVTERGEVYYNSDKNRWEFTPAPSDDNANGLDEEVITWFREAAQAWCDAFWCEWKAALPGLLREVWRLANESHFFAMRSDKEWAETLRPAYKKAEGIMLASLDNGQFDELINASRWHNAPIRYQYFGGYYEAGLSITPAEAKAMQAELYGEDVK